MSMRSQSRIPRLAGLLAIATALAALVAAPALGQDRPASSYYTPQDLQRMSDSWAARGGVLTNVPASSYYLPQQIESMSRGWAARGGLLPASAKATPTTSDGFDWGDFGIGAAATFGLVLLTGGTALAVLYRRSAMRPRAVT